MSRVADSEKRTDFYCVSSALDVFIIILQDERNIKASCELVYQLRSCLKYFGHR